jgi:hypothetical protein
MYRIETVFARSGAVRGDVDSLAVALAGVGAFDEAFEFASDLFCEPLMTHLAVRTRSAGG